MLRTLEELGLTLAESKVYLALLKKGPSLAGVITREVGVHRRTVYDILHRLIAKGLVSHIIMNGKRHFEAVNPDRLVELLKEKEDNLKLMLPELRGLYRTTKEKKEVLFFRGKQSLKTVFDDQLKEGKEILFMGKGVNVNEILKYYFQRFDLKRVEKNIPIKMVFNAEATKLPFIKKIPLAEIKYIENWNYSAMSTYIYGNNVSIVIWSEDPIAILVRQKEMADGFRNYFEILWNVAKSEVII